MYYLNKPIIVGFIAFACVSFGFMNFGAATRDLVAISLGGIAILFFVVASIWLGTEKSKAPFYVSLLGGTIITLNIIAASLAANTIWSRFHPDNAGALGRIVLDLSLFFGMPMLVTGVIWCALRVNGNLPESK
ncbi:MAG: hypothetical protein JWL82_135 [Parcubacteria group bacterium]|nr:hypothetical protein [Parcubacteria group bacterium]